MNKILYTLIAILLVLPACGGNKADREKARNDYKQALSDSIASASTSIDECNNRIAILNDQMNNLLQDFSIVSNPREVEGYYILNGWQKRYPMQTTGLVARVSENEQLELIATLKGSTFDAIEAVGPTSSAVSATVPHDQALNYRREGLTSVMFSGAKADSIGQLIANNELNNIKIVYLEGNGKTKGNWQMPQEFKNMVARTYALASARKELRSLERRVVMLREKINLLRAHLDSSAVASPDSIKQ